MSILYVINSPCWTDIAPKRLNNSKMFDHPLSENFTFFYYNLMKYGLVKKVIIYNNNKRRGGIDYNFVQSKLQTDYGVMEIKDHTERFNEINADPLQNYVFCWTNIHECQNIKNKFIIIDNQYHGYNKKSDVNEKIHNFVLTESKNFKKYINKNLPVLDYKLISYDHKIFMEKKYERKFKYDWILVSSFDKRKRHLKFLEIMSKSNLKNLKGCIVARDPNNKKKNIFDYFRTTPWSIYSKVLKYKKKLDFDIFINCHQKKKIELTYNSKIYINPSILDTGPRAQVEAMQLKTPVVTLSHIGASDIVKNGTNGEIVNSIEEIPPAIKLILSNYQKYYNSELVEELLDEHFMPKLVKNIREEREKIKIV